MLSCSVTLGLLVHRNMASAMLAASVSQAAISLGRIDAKAGVLAVLSTSGGVRSRGLMN